MAGRVKRLVGWSAHAENLRPLCRMLDWSWRPSRVLDMLRKEFRAASTRLGLVSMPYRDLPALAAEGLLLPLDEHLPASALACYARQAVELCRHDGKLIAFPDDLQPYALMVRTDILRQHGLSPAQTWLDLERQATVLSGKLKRAAFGVPSGANIHRLGFVLSLFGSAGIDVSDGLDASLQGQASVQGAYDWALRFLPLCRAISGTKTGTKPSGWLDPLRRGELAGCFGWPGPLAAWPVALQKKLRILPFPHGPSPTDLRFTPCHGHAWIIPRATVSPQQAVAALNRLRERKVLRQLESKGGCAFPASLAMARDPAVLKKHPVYRDAATVLSGSGRPFTAGFVHGPCQETLAAFDGGMLKNLPAAEWFRRMSLGQLEAAGKSAKRAEIRAALRHLESRLLEIRRVSDLARLVGLSPDHLNRIFQAELHVSCGAYLRRARMEKARAWLVESSFSVKEVAFRLGFQGPAPFSRAFRREFGIGPAQFRKEHTA